MAKAGRGGSGSAPGDDDASAPLHFLLAILVCVVTPWLCSVLWSLLFPGRQELQRRLPETTEDGLRVRQVQTRAMSTKRDELRSLILSRRRLFTPGFVVRTAILALLLCWLGYIIVQIKTIMDTSAMYQNFDPHEILGVSRHASMADVKKAMRRMSLQYHPDKNPEPGAAERFLLIQKANDALTDPIAKRNYERYGNPDGPTRVKLGVALPAVSKENQGVVLILFVLLFILALPLTMIYCFGRGNTDPSGVLNETVDALREAMKDKAIDMRTAQRLLLDSGESSDALLRARSPNDTEQEELLRAELLDSGKSSKALMDVGNPKAGILLLSHFRRRHQSLTPALAADLDGLLERWRLVVRYMLHKAAKAGNVESMLVCLELHWCLAQALEPGKTSASGMGELLQVPFFDMDRAKAWRKGPLKSAGLRAFLELESSARRTSLDSLSLDEQTLLDIDEFAATAPRITMGPAKVFVDGEDDICKGDVATLRVQLRRESLREGEAVGLAHTPLFPTLIEERWWLVVEYQGVLARPTCRQLTFLGRELKEDVKFMVQKAGANRCKVRVLCETYVGLNLEEQVTFKVASQSKPKKVAKDAGSSGGEHGVYEESDDGSEHS